MSTSPDSRQENPNDKDDGIFKNFLKSHDDIKKQKEAIPRAPAKDAAEYDMTHSKRGKTIIFNHYEFIGDSKANRAGSEHDVRALRHQFTYLDFDVEVHQDLTRAEIFHVLESVAASEDDDVDCLVVVVMTHGDPNQLSARDSTYRCNRLWETFTADKCKALAAKPKIFIIQACRGTSVDDGVRVAPIYTQTDSAAKVTYTIPVWSDIMIVNATFDGHFAWRSADTGSVFIQALCRELNMHAATKEICQILTGVNRHVAISYSSHVPTDRSRNAKKQMPNFLSTLTRELYFRPKSS